jgi:arylsulfatase A-like enzyme
MATNRREFLNAIALPALLAGPVHAADRNKPNILYITSDQQRADELSSVPNRLVRTPNLDRMAREGAVFPNAFCQFPVCLPSRTSMLTGRYAHAHRVGSNSAKLPADEVLLPDMLRAQGYSAMACGVVEQELARHFDEYDFTPALRPHPSPELGDMDRIARSAIFTAPEEKHWDMRCLRAAQRMMKTAPHPQFLYISFHQPHGIIAPLERFARKYSPAEMPLPPSYAAGLAGRTQSFRRQVGVRGVPELTRIEQQTIQARRFASVEMIDSFVGEILHTLQAEGTADRTIVVYQSDHGDFGGEFGLVDKSPTCLADALIRIPMVLWAPKRLPSAGSLCALVQEIDVLPTLLELAGLSAAARAQGKSMVPLVKNRAEQIHDAVFAETESKFSSRMIRTKDWKLILSAGAENELYDLRKDPGETRNLFGSCPEVERDLTQSLHAWLARTPAG